MALLSPSVWGGQKIPKRLWIPSVDHLIHKHLEIPKSYGYQIIPPKWSFNTSLWRSICFTSIETILTTIQESLKWENLLHPLHKFIFFFAIMVTIHFTSTMIFSLFSLLSNSTDLSRPYAPKWSLPLFLWTPCIGGTLNFDSFALTINTIVQLY